MDIPKTIDRAIKEVWKDNIIKDVDDRFVLLEDSLKNTFYYHLRGKLGDGFLKRNLIRIFTEYRLHRNKKADIAIVSLKAIKDLPGNYHLREQVNDIIAIIELKHKGNRCGYKPFWDDIEKTRRYIRIKKYQRCQFYLGFIHERYYSNDDISWLTKRQQESWAKGRLTELNAYYDIESDRMVSKILSYNNLNPMFNCEYI